MQKTIFILITLIFTLSLSAQGLVSGNIYYTMNKEELLAQADKLSGQEDSFEKYSNLGIIYHFLSSLNVDGAEKSVEYFQKALEYDNENYIIKAYMGSSYTLLGNEEKVAGKKLKMVKKGIQILDQVFYDHSDDYEVNILMIYNTLGVSGEMFQRLYLAEAAVNNLENSRKKLTKEQIAEILYLKSLVLFATDKELEAIKIWKNIIRKYPGSNYADAAKEKLKEFEE